MLVWRWLFLLQFFVLLSAYTYLGLAPHPEDSIPTFNDKLMHFSGYFIAAFSISFAFPWWSLWWRAIFLTLYSIAIEIGQHFMPPRTFDVFDIYANTSGVLVGLLLLTLFSMKVQWFKSLLCLRQK